MTTITGGGDADLIACALYQLGFRPRESLLVMGLEPTARGVRTVGAAARLPLPDPTPRATTIRAAAADLASVLTGAGATASLLVVLTERPAGEVRRIVRSFRAGLIRSGVPPLSSYQVTAEHYREVDCRDPRCCPPPGRPLAEVLTSPTATWCVTEGRTLAGCEEDLVADVMPGDGDGASREDRGAVARERGGAGSDQWLQTWLDALDGVDGVDGVDGADALRALPDAFGSALVEVRLRDAVLLSVAGGTPDDARASLRDPTTMDALMRGRPDPVRTSRATALLAACARRSRGRARAELLAVLAWLAWWEGSGARARLLVGLARDLEPGHRLAGLVDLALVRALPPPWVVPDAGGGRAAPDTASA